MSAEIEPTARGLVEPMQKTGSGSRNIDPVPYVPMPIDGRYDAPDFVELIPPADTEFQELWSKVVMPFRALALAFLWVTWRWWRFGALVVTVVLIIFLIANW